nr:class I SAM-dependent methyltransferase [Salsipaludibacter albus]
MGLVGFRPGWRVLDAPGGAGRHAIPLALLGARVTLVDRAPGLLDRARRDAGGAGIDLRVVDADLRRPLDLPLPADGHGPPFDLVVNLYNSFGYFPTQAQDEVLLDSLADAVAPGGRLVLEVANRAAALAEPEREVVEVDGVTVRAHRRWAAATQQLTSHYRLEPRAGVAVSTGTVQRLYRPEELVAMVEGRGLATTDVVGDLDGRPLDDEQDYVVVVARRPG